MLVEPVQLSPLGRDVASAVLSFQIKYLTSEAPQTGVMSVVFVRTDRWRVAHDHTSTPSVHVAPNTAFQQVPTQLPSRRRGRADLPLDGSPNGPIGETFECEVTEVVDGDTIKCADEGSVRLLGIDAPERDQVPFGEEASRALQDMIPVGAYVVIELDIDERDRYGRLLGYVWAGGTQINWLMVRAGWAVMLTYSPNVQYVDDLRQAQQAAREEGAGLWSASGFDCLPSAHRRGECDRP